jgi:hypothetical protein
MRGSAAGWTAFPRAGLAQEFTACFADQAARKPAGTAAAAMRSGLAERIVINPLDSEEGSRHRSADLRRPRH